MIRSYLIYLLLFQTIVYADDETLIKRNRIKRLGPANTTLYNYVTATSTSESIFDFESHRSSYSIF